MTEAKKNFSTDEYTKSVAMGGICLDEDAELPSNWLSDVREENGTFTNEFSDWIKDSVAVDSGKPLVFWHATNTEFIYFDEEEQTKKQNAESEAGFHFGTKHAALNRSQNNPSRRLLPVILSIKQPLRIEDAIAFVPGNPNFVKIVRKAVMSDLRVRAENDFSSEEELEEKQRKFKVAFTRAVNTGDASKIRDVLETFGYDAFVYQNTQEERRAQQQCDSVMVFRAEQIRNAQTGCPLWKQKNNS